MGDSLNLVSFYFPKLKHALNSNVGHVILIQQNLGKIKMFIIYSGQQIKIGTIAACGKLSWKLLDGLIERLFTEYLMLVDPVTNLGLSAESVLSYNIGDLIRLLYF